MQIPDAAQWSTSFNVDRATQAWLDTVAGAQRLQSNAYFEGGYWLLLIWVLSLPLSIYQGYFREHHYGLANQSFLPWFAEQGISLALLPVFGSVFIALLYAVVRRTGERWWAWGAGLVTLFVLLSIVIAPVFVLPLFNDYRPLPPGETRDSILSLARANGIPAGNVYVFDASKQTTRISANVAGALGTTRIALNDNLLNHTSLPEIRAVMAHEMGHFVLHHIWRSVIYLGVLTVFALLLLHWTFVWLLQRWGARLGIKDRADVAGLPLAFASVAMRLSSYRKLTPGALEELLMYDHPSGRTRVHMAMQWLKENPPAASAVTAVPAPAPPP